MPEKFKSRKFWFALIGAILPIAAQALTDDIAATEAIRLSAGVIIAYLFGQGYVDGKALEGTK
jgi:hypothetical protein